MHAIRLTRCSLFALCIAIWQVLAPVAAYAHMARQGTLTQQICGASGIGLSVLIDDGAGSGVSGAAAGSLASGDHLCCPGALPWPPSPGPHACPPPHGLAQGELWVGQTIVQQGAPRHRPPATGPPRST